MQCESLIGLLLDVSGSMKNNAVGSVDAEGEWIRSLFQVIDDVIKHDVQSYDHQVFAIGFGGQSDEGTFDILKSIDKAQKLEEIRRKTKPSFLYSLFGKSTVSKIFTLLEQHGAAYLRNWTKVGTVEEYLPKQDADLVLLELENDTELARRVVYECLPSACREVPQTQPGAGVLRCLCYISISTASVFKQATQSEVQEAVQSGLALIKANKLVPVDVKTANTFVPYAAQTIRGTVNNYELSATRIQELLDLVTPFIYGSTPIESALTSARKLFRAERAVAKNKVMIVISDGEWGTELSFDGWFKDVTIICCFVSRSSNIRPRHLFDTADVNWNDGAKNLFKLSSVVPSQLLPRWMLIHNGWSFDIEKNETKLFAHVNNPEHMREICRLGKNIACNQECLSDFLVTVSLDLYINQSNTGFSARRQEGGTCYANASATAIHLSLKRILGREDGYPNFETLRDELILLHGADGADTFGVLRSVCPRYRLRCREVYAKNVFNSIIAKRVVVGKFRLTDKEWERFAKFYQLQPKGILSNQILERWKRSWYEETRGHAVVVTGYTNNCLILMNSWGDDWADNGFFRVESADVLGLEFMDVFWTDDDLTRSEKEYYKKHGSEVAKELISKLRGLQKQEYTCPLCRKTSPVNWFSGTLSRAKCPRCNTWFNCKEAGNILAMNIYLTSMATSEQQVTA